LVIASLFLNEIAAPLFPSCGIKKTLWLAWGGQETYKTEDAAVEGVPPPVVGYVARGKGCRGGLGRGGGNWLKQGKEKRSKRRQVGVPPFPAKNCKIVEKQGG